MTEVHPPSRFDLPQRFTADRRRARRATTEARKRRYALFQDPGIEGMPGARLPPFLAPWEGASRLRRAMVQFVGRLPPPEAFVSELPPESRFSGSKFFRHGTHAGSMKLRQAWLRLTNFDFRPGSEAAYERLMGTIPAPANSETWRDDVVFARQRLIGVNPMAIQRLRKGPGNALGKAADRVLRASHDADFSSAMEQGRMYFTEYGVLAHPQIQKHVPTAGRKPAWLAAPTCLFYADEAGLLHPIAIQLKPPVQEERNPVFTPLDGRADWLIARAHVQASDSHLHEAIYHLLETHLVSEVFAIATGRELHPDHPLAQLLAPHFENTYAINEQARKNLLGAHGEIARCMAARHTGAIDAVRMVAADWKHDERTIEADFAARDVEDLPNYFYRDDARHVWDTIHAYVTEILSVWYDNDEDVRDDSELTAWLQALRDPGQLRLQGLPERLETREALFDLITHVIFRGSAQHAAVNNGQFGSYGWIPNASTAVYSKPPDQLPADPTEDESVFFEALPDRARTLGQAGMVWLLSEPTERSLLRAGECAAFLPETQPAAAEAVGRFRRRLRALSDAIDRRSDETGISYTYLKPQNIDRSISI